MIFIVCYSENYKSYRIAASGKTNNREGVLIVVTCFFNAVLFLQQTTFCVEL